MMLWLLRLIFLQWLLINKYDNKIHPTAIIDPKAKIGKNIEIGAFSIIGPKVKIGDNNIIKSNVIITGDTKIGDNNVFFPFAVIGEDPQDLKYQGEE